MQPARLRAPQFAAGTVLLLGLAAAALSSFAATARAAEPPASAAQLHVTIPAGATLPQALNAVSNAVGVPCIAQSPSTPTALAKEYDGSLSGALDAIRTTFDLQPSVLTNRITFLRRYSEPGEKAELPLEELRSISADLASVIHPFRTAAQVAPGGLGSDAWNFVASLSPEQRQALNGEGLPYTSLTPQQALLFRAITARLAVHDADTRVASVNSALSAWDRCELHWNAQPNEGWRLRYPSATSPTGFGDLRLPATIDPGDDLSRQPHVETWQAARTSEGGGGSRLVPIPGGDQPLRKLIHSVAESAAREIRIPAYALDRRLVLNEGQIRTDVLLAAVCDMYGWEIRPSASGALDLGRPLFAPDTVRTPAGLHTDVLAAIPPSLGTLLTRGGDKQYFCAQMAAVVEGRSGDDWAKGVRVTSLPAELQERAAQVFSVAVLSALRRNAGALASPQLPGWFSNPERGVLTGRTSSQNSPPYDSGDGFINFQTARKESGWGYWWVKVRPPH